MEPTEEKGYRSGIKVKEIGRPEYEALVLRHREKPADTIDDHFWWWETDGTKPIHNALAMECTIVYAVNNATGHIISGHFINVSEAAAREGGINASSYKSLLVLREKIESWKTGNGADKLEIFIFGQNSQNETIPLLDVPLVHDQRNPDPDRIDNTYYVPGEKTIYHYIDRGA